jgi:hypothetical protein
MKASSESGLWAMRIVVNSAAGAATANMEDTANKHELNQRRKLC